MFAALIWLKKAFTVLEIGTKLQTKLLDIRDYLIIYNQYSDILHLKLFLSSKIVTLFLLYFLKNNLTCILASSFPQPTASLLLREEEKKLKIQFLSKTQ